MGAERRCKGPKTLLKRHSSRVYAQVGIIVKQSANIAMLTNVVSKLLEVPTMRGKAVTKNHGGPIDLTSSKPTPRGRIDEFGTGTNYIMGLSHHTVAARTRRASASRATLKREPTRKTTLDQRGRSVSQGLD